MSDNNDSAELNEKELTGVADGNSQTDGPGSTFKYEIGTPVLENGFNIQTVRTAARLSVINLPLQTGNRYTL